MRLAQSLSTHKFSLAGVILCLVVLSIPAIYVGNDYRLRSKYDDALNRIQVGDSESTVVALMGEPDEREWCYPLRTDHDSTEQRRFHDSCVQQYCYYTFLKRYTVSLDKTNHVSFKNVAVSP